MGVLRAVLPACLIVCAAHAVEGEEPSPKPVRLVRDLGLVPPGRYRIVQSWDAKGSETSEHGGGKPADTRAISSSNRFTFGVEVAPSRDGISGVGLQVVVERVEIRLEDQPKPVGSYDSAGPPAKQAEILHRQFHSWVGATSRAEGKAVSEGPAFRGFDEVWERFGTEHPEMSRAAAANLQNYGDARLDRMFAVGLDVLFGGEEGATQGKSRDLRAGEEFRTKLRRPGIFMKPTDVDVACKVVSTDRGQVVLRAEWKENGFLPDAGGPGLRVRGGDVHSVATFTFVANGGYLVRYQETLERTDQEAPGPAGALQWTRRVVEKKDFSFTKR